MKKLFLIGALGATALAGAAYAAQSDAPKPGDRGGAHFAKMDTNGDGVVSKDEVLAMADKRFAKLDTNGDGKLSPEEMAAGRKIRGPGHGRHHGHHGRRGMMAGGPDMPPPPPGAGAPGDRAAMHAEMLKRFDKDGDGKLSPDERKAARDQWMADHPDMAARFQAMRDQRMKQLDTNGDGTVSPEERDAARAKWQAARADMGAKMQAAMFAKLDTNKDGFIDKAEFEAVALSHFAKVDTNGDGKIDAAERDAAHAKMMSGMKGRHGPMPGGMMPPPPPPEDAPDAPSGN